MSEIHISESADKMKKILITLTILIATALAAGGYYLYEIMNEKKNPTILLIDGEKIKASELWAFKMDGKPCESVEKCMDKFIEMELIVSYGKKNKLDTAPSMKDIQPEMFNEKLAAIALEKKLSSIDSSPSSEEAEAYLKLYKGKVSITTYIYEDLESAKSGGDPSGKSKTISFEKLSGPVSYMVGMLTPGNKTNPFKTDAGYEIIQLDIMEQDLAATGNIPEKEKNLIIEKLEKDKKDYLFEKWKYELKEKADIKTTDKLKELKL